MQGDILIGNWLNNRLNGSVFSFEKQGDKWVHYEFLLGKCDRIIGRENGEKRDLMKDYKDYEILLEKGLCEYFKEFVTINGSLKLFDFEEKM